MAELPTSQVPRAVGRRSLVGTPTRLANPTGASAEALGQLGARIGQFDDLERRQESQTLQNRLGAEVERSLSGAVQLALETTDPDQVLSVYQKNAQSALSHLSTGVENPENLDLLEMHGASRIGSDERLLGTHIRALRQGNLEASLVDAAKAESSIATSGGMNHEDMFDAVTRFEAMVLNTTGLDELTRSKILRQFGADIELEFVGAAIANRQYENASEALQATRYLSPEQKISKRDNITQSRSLDTAADLTVQFNAQVRGQPGTLPFSEPVARDRVEAAYNRGILTPIHRENMHREIDRLSASDIKSALDRSAWQLALDTKGVMLGHSAKQIRENAAGAVSLAATEIIDLFKSQNKGREPNIMEFQLLMAEQYRLADPDTLGRVADVAVRDPDLKNKAEALEHIRQLRDAMRSNTGYQWMSEEGQNLAKSYIRIVSGARGISPADQRRNEAAGVVGPLMESNNPEFLATISPQAATLLAIAENETAPGGTTQAQNAAILANGVFNNMTPEQRSELVAGGVLHAGGVNGYGFWSSVGFVDTGKRPTSLFSPNTTLGDHFTDLFKAPFSPQLVDKIFRRAQSRAILSGNFTPDSISRHATEAAYDILHNEHISLDRFNAVAEGDAMFGPTTVDQFVNLPFNPFDPGSGETIVWPMQAQRDSWAAETIADNMRDPKDQAALRSSIEQLYSLRAYSWRMPEAMVDRLTGERLADNIGPGFIPRPSMSPLQRELQQEVFAFADAIDLDRQETVEMFSNGRNPAFRDLVRVYQQVRGVNDTTAWTQIRSAMELGDSEPFDLVAIPAETRLVGGEPAQQWTYAARGIEGGVPRNITPGGQSWFLDFDTNRDVTVAGLTDPSVFYLGINDIDEAAVFDKMQKFGEDYAKTFEGRAVAAFEKGLNIFIDRPADFEGPIQRPMSKKELLERSAQETQAVRQRLIDQIQSGQRVPAEALQEAQQTLRSGLPPNEADIVRNFGLQVKRGVNVEGLKPEVLQALPAYTETMAELGIKPADRSITSGVRSPATAIQTFIEKGRSTLHPMGYAADLRGNGLTLEQGEAAAQMIRSKLGNHYFVQFETKDEDGQALPPGERHFHLEYETPEIKARLRKFLVTGER